MKNIFIFFLWFLVFLLPVTCRGQFSADCREKKHVLLGYPVVFYMPETRWGFGASALYSFYFHPGDSLSVASQIQPSFVYTLNHQVLAFVNYDLYWSGRSNRLSGEVGYYRYHYQFFGVGPSMPDDFQEPFQEQYPRFRVNYLHRLKKNVFVGARYWFEDHDVFEREVGGLLDADTIAGSRGSRTSGPGLVAVFDSRDAVGSTRKGYYIEAVWHTQSAFWGSEYTYDRYRFDARAFFTVGKGQVVATQAFGDFLQGSVPFLQMASVGSAKRMRGYYDGKVRDKNLVLVQAEYRVELWPTIGAVAFCHLGSLAGRPELLRLDQSRFAAGGGLRYTIDGASRLKLRLDYAVGRNSSAWYFTAGEAF